MAGTGRSRLHEAAIEGNVTILLELLQQDPLLLDRDNLNHLNETPLHVAALLGHVGFVDEILKRRPQLAGELDSRRSSPLHFAAAKGFLQIVKRLLQVDVDVCFVCNEDGRNPLHLAAMKGRLNVLTELIRARPAAARIAVDDGGTVLHLCVKYNQLEALKILVGTVAADDSFLNKKDEYGFTVLHLAVSNKQIKTVQYLVDDTGIEINALNSSGLTALDILAQSHRDIKDMDIAETLTAAGAFRTANKTSSSSSSVKKNKKTKFNNWLSPAIYDSKDETWLSRKQDAIMVVASLIATMAFQAGVNPPGGVWQDDDASGDPNQTAGKSIMAGKHPGNYNKYLGFNTTGFTASLIVILMLITGLPFKHPIYVRVLVVSMWIAVSSMAFTYGYSIRFFTPKHSDMVIFKIALVVSFATVTSLGLFLLGKLFHLLSRQAGKVNTYFRTPATHQEVP